MKKCCKCKISRGYTFFGKSKRSSDGYRGDCKCCRAKYYARNKEYIKGRVKNNYNNNKDRVKKYQKEYWMKNKDKLTEYKKNYIKKNKDKINKYYREYNVKKRREDCMSRLRHNYRNRTYNAFCKKGFSKSSSTMTILGADWEFLKEYIEAKFSKGMNWSNYGEWHIDHIIPLSTAKTKSELEKLCHYTNLQPLWEFDNLSKGSKTLTK